VYLLDTNTCIFAINKRSRPLIKTLREHRPAEVFLSSIVKAELLFGARHSVKVAENLEVLANFFQPFGSVAFDDVCAEHYGLIRAELATLGHPIGPNDLLIAATARAHDLTLVTNNTREFSRVPALRLVDWTAAG
jgi:tRNA(fMet)-specific endonuclease VapC